MAALTAGLNVPLNLYLRYGVQLPEEFISLFRALQNSKKRGAAEKLEINGWMLVFICGVTFRYFSLFVLLLFCGSCLIALTSVW